jgi:hypothetical protein
MSNSPTGVEDSKIGALFPETTVPVNAVPNGGFIPSFWSRNGDVKRSDATLNKLHEEYSVSYSYMGKSSCKSILATHTPGFLDATAQYN